MKISTISISDANGGAARAAYRIHHALRSKGIDSTMLVNYAVNDDWTVKGPLSKREKLFTKIKPRLVPPLVKTLKTKNLVIHSPSILPSSLVKTLNQNDSDLIHLHWVQNEMLSIADIGLIRKPVVWTLHDMWGFCGAEHYTEDFRWRDGYLTNNRPDYESGFDLNRWTALRKLKHWKQPINIVSPSNWLADCAKNSILMKDWSVTVIPNAIDTNIWQPVNKAIARKLLQLPVNVPLILFGAMGGSKDPRKGFDLLKSALNHLRGQFTGIEIVVFGQSPPKSPENIGFPVHYTGHMFDEVSLRLLYSASDVLIIPSRQDNLPNTGIEAHACGTPVIAFDTCGLSDIVTHRQTGYLAKAFDTEDLAVGIQWVIEDAERHSMLSSMSRKKAVSQWSCEIVAPQYNSLYQSVLNSKI